MAKSKSQRRPQGATTPASRAAGGATTATKPAASGSGTTGTTGTTATKSAAQAKTQAGTQTGSQLAAIRARTPQRPQVRRRYQQRQPWWRRNLAAIVSLAVVVAVVIGFIVHAQQQNASAAVDIGSPAPQSVLTALSNISPKTEAAVGSGGVQIGFQGTPAGTAVLTSNGLPEVVYIGAEYCPYCAADRWGMIMALDHFGTFKGLTLMKSSSSDVFPNTNTFTFKGATYTSKYLVFNPTETQDRNQQTLDSPSGDALASFNTYDTTPYTNVTGGIPFISYGNQYVTTNTPFTPTMLQGLSWQQIATDLNNPKSSVTQNIVGTSNLETAAICRITNNQPASVCSASYIQQLEATLPTR